MKRTFVIGIALIAGVFTLSACRARDNAGAGKPAPAPAATATQAPKPSVAPQEAASKVTVNLSEVDSMLAELDRQIAEAEKTPDVDE